MMALLTATRLRAMMRCVMIRTYFVRFASDCLDSQPAPRVRWRMVPAC